MDNKDEHRSIDRHTLRLFREATMRDKRLFGLALFFPLGSIITSVLVPLVIGRIIAALSHTQADPMSYIPYLVGFALLGIITNRIGAASLFALQAKGMADLQEQAFRALMRRSMSFHNNNVGGKLVSDVIDFPQAYGGLLDALFTNITPFVLVMICGSAVVFAESWQLGLMITLMSAYTLVASYLNTRRRAPIRKRRMAKVKEVTSHAADAIVNIPTIKAFAREQLELRSHHRLSQQLANLRITDWRSGAKAGNNRIAVLTAMQVIFILLLIRAVNQDPAVLGVGVFAFSFIGMLSLRLIQLSALIRTIEDSFLDASPMTEILLQEPEIQNAPHAKKLIVSKGALELSHVTFRYDDSSQHKQVFSDLNVQIKPGERIGLVGPSGGGKSTFTRLLMRFEDIDSGVISIDGQDISVITQESLRQAIAYVPQEPLLFHRTIAENIAYGQPKAGRKDIEQAAKRAYAHDFIKELADGYDTIVGERGVKLSGGQRQRVAIARAILKDAPILLLDEATSALDSESEAFIQEALIQLMKGRTTLVIAHRLSTIQHMDRIMVLESGKITEQGTHQELRDNHGTYAKLWAHQSGGFITE
jgi:ATP-binding cassette subfamily B protein